MKYNKEKNRKALDSFFDLIKDKKNRRIAFRQYLTFFPEFNRKDKLAKKQERYDYFRKHSENGYTHLIESGMDCDGVQYRYVGEKIKCVPIVLDKEIDRIHYSADGSVSVNCVKPSEAEKIEDVSIDRGMEASENGHPHTFRMGSF
tara:strand:+ start:365 stop:802 length:438 start_codon:yes stop_codon:yes gene_type:complete